jgi:pre-mRNA-splicing factor 38B
VPPLGAPPPGFPFLAQPQQAQQPQQAPAGLQSLLQGLAATGLPQLQVGTLPTAGAGTPGPPPQPFEQNSAQLAAESARAAAAAAAVTAQQNKIKKDGQMREQAVAKEEANKKKCHLHSKPNKKCKFCARYEEFMKGQDKSNNKDDPSQKGSRSGGADDLSETRGPLELVNSKTFGFSPLLQTHIVESAHLKALLTLETFDQLVEEMYQFADNIEPYMANSSTTPSALFCCLYRLFTMGIAGPQLRRLIDNSDNAYVRCCGFLFIRFGLTPEQLWPWLGEYVLDDEELRPAKDSEWATTIGEFVEGLLTQDKYYSIVLPRLPMSTKRQLEAKLAPITQYRKRTNANLDLLDVYRQENVKVEANCNGDWITGYTIELVDDAPSRLKVRVRLEDSTEETVHLGKVILADKRFANHTGTRSNRDRSRSRDRTDWARDKGRTDKELVTELRTKDREKAVCSSGKDYARKPLGYKASCALPREQGTASTRLMEEETFVPMKQVRRRSPSPATREQEFRKAPSAEHQARMQALFEKYGMGKTEQQSSSGYRELDSADVMRLG